MDMEDTMRLVVRGLLAISIVTFVSALLAPIAALPIMLMLGVVHNDISSHVPALGFWACVVLAWASPVALGTLRGLKVTT